MRGREVEELPHTEAMMLMMCAGLHRSHRQFIKAGRESTDGAAGVI